MCCKFVFRVLVMSLLCLTAPRLSHAQPPRRGLGLRGGVGWGGAYWRGGYLGGWGGFYRYGWVPYYPHAYPYHPYSFPYYPYYGLYYQGDVTQSNHYATPYSEDSLQTEAPHPTGSTNPVAPPDAGLVQLRVPDKFAQVFFNGQEVGGVGSIRAYVTPELPAGTYKYQVKATWGQTTRQQTIEVVRGRISEVDFTAGTEGQAR